MRECKKTLNISSVALSSYAQDWLVRDLPPSPTSRTISDSGSSGFPPSAKS